MSAAHTTPFITKAEPAPNWWMSKRTKWSALLATTAALIGVITWWFGFHPFVTSDDARIAATMVRVAPEAIGGRVIKIWVEEGAKVKRGDPLAELDHRIADAQLLKAQARADLSARELRRITELVHERGMAAKDLDLANANAQIAQAELKLAQVAAENTTIRSPVNGVVVQKVGEEGNIIEPGQTVFTVADIEQSWVAANIEETNVGAVKVGQSVQIQVDEGGTLSGTVSEVRASVASQFALIPSDTGAGNFTKVVQRVPIKISINRESERELRAGQSVEIKIRVR